MKERPHCQLPACKCTNLKLGRFPGVTVTVTDSAYLPIKAAQVQAFLLRLALHVVRSCPIVNCVALLTRL